MRGRPCSGPGQSDKTTSSRRSVTKRRSELSSPPTTRPPRKDKDVEALTATASSSLVDRAAEAWRPRRHCSQRVQSLRFRATLGLGVSALAELRGAKGEAAGIVADVGTADGRTETLRHALDALGGLDILMQQRRRRPRGRLEVTTEAEIEAMLNVDLLAPVLLTRAALPSLRASGDAMVINVRGHPGR